MPKRFSPKRNLQDCSPIGSVMGSKQLDGKSRYFVAYARSWIDTRPDDFD
jgi:hypothetical protein